MDVYGKDSMSELLGAFYRGGNEDYAFYEAFGVSTLQFESEYVVWLEERLKTPPPISEVRLQKPIFKEEQRNLPNIPILALFLALCLIPLCFVAIGAIALVVLWQLNNALSEKRS